MKKIYKKEVIKENPDENKLLKMLKADSNMKSVKILEKYHDSKNPKAIDHHHKTHKSKKNLQDFSLTD